MSEIRDSNVDPSNNANSNGNDGNDSAMMNSSSLLRNESAESIMIEPPNVEKFISLGNEAEKMLKIHQAIEHYDSALAISPNNIKSIKQKALCLCNNNRSNEAFELLNKLINSQKNSIEFICIKGQCYNSLGNYTEALNTYNQCLQQEPSYSEARLNKSKCLINLKQYNKAIATLDNINEDDSLNFEAVYLKGLCQMYHENYDKALSLFKYVLQNSFEAPELYSSVGKCYDMNNMYSEAIVYYEKSTKYFPNDIVYYRLAVCYFNRKQYKKSLYSLEMCLALNKHHEEALELKIKALIATNQLNKALESYMDLIDLAPNNIQLYIDASQMYLKRSAFTEAQQVLNKGNKRLVNLSEETQLNYSNTITSLMTYINQHQNTSNCQCCCIF